MGLIPRKINSAFDYDIVSSKDESSGITSSDETESGSDNAEVLVIPPTPEKRKVNQFVQTNNTKSVATCTKLVKQQCSTGIWYQSITNL